MEGAIVGDRAFGDRLFTTVTLCPGTFDSVFEGFVSPLWEPLAPKVPSPNLATLSAFLA
jgi:hypothetical protein